MAEDQAIRNMVLMVLISICVIVGMGNLIGNVATNYNVTANTSYFNDSQTYIEELHDSATNLRDAVEKAQSWNPLGWFEGMTAVLGLLWTAGTVTGSFITGLEVMFNIAGFLPVGWFVGILVIMVTVIVVFELISAVLKRGV
jgi:hypothetical protein